MEEVVTKALPRLSYIDSHRLIELVIDKLPEIDKYTIDDFDGVQQRMWQMLQFTIWQNSYENCGFGDVIESKTVHDYVTCSCGRCSVDGGMEYLRRAYTDRRTDFQELSEYDVRLNIQDFLKAKTDEGLSFAKIKELLAGAPYHITVTEKDSLALFKYSQLESDWNEPICRECRGLILEKGSWKVVRYAFDKFFNINERYAAEIDWASATSTEKIDGSLISLFYYKDKWRVAMINVSPIFSPIALTFLLKR